MSNKNNGEVITQIGVDGKINVNEEVITKTSSIPSDELARVGVGCSLTINLGNYQTARVMIYVELPGRKNELNNIYNEALKFAEEKLAMEVEKIRQYRDKLVGSLGTNFEIPEP